MSRARRRAAAGSCARAFGAVLAFAAAEPLRAAAPQGGPETYQTLCATCHGSDGRGEPGKALFSLEMPDFSDCSFAAREADLDWIAVTHAGGPARAFSVVMPAFGDSLDARTLAEVVAHLRSFCRDARWPRGELNLPRPFYTEKAYPEDELVASADAALEGESALTTELIFEKRIGARHQVEIALPFELAENAANRHRGGGIGDLALAAKSAIFHDLERGSILALGSELLLPTGDDERGRGSGTVIFEPYLSLGQLVAEDGFVQLQLAGEIPAEGDRGDPEILTRAALGWSFTAGRFGRSVTPMLEILNAQVFDRGRPDDVWDLVPQLQAALSQRQHLLLSVGVRVPVSDRDERSVRFVTYLLWDWYDGGFTEGWR